MPELHPHSSSSSSIQVVESFLNALRESDFKRAEALLADDVVYQNVPLAPNRGKAEVERSLRGFLRFVDEFDVTMHNIAERDGVVLTERTDILRGPWVDLDFWVCGTFEVRDGKIVLWRDRFDVAEVLLQLVTSPVRRLLKPRRTAK